MGGAYLQLKLTSFDFQEMDAHLGPARTFLAVPSLVTTNSARYVLDSFQGFKNQTVIFVIEILRQLQPTRPRYFQNPRFNKFLQNEQSEESNDIYERLRVLY